MKHDNKKHICVAVVLLGLLSTLPSVYAAKDSAPGKLKYSDEVTEVIKLGKRGGALSPAGHNFSKTDNASFTRAMEDWNAHNWKSAVNRFKAHNEAYPNSPWVGESDLHMGCYYRYTNQIDLAKSQFSKIMQHYPDTEVAHKAKKRLAGTYYLSGDYQQAKETYRELALDKSVNPRHRTYALHQMRHMSMILSRQPKTQAERLNQCGLKSLALLYQQNNLHQRAVDIEQLATTAEKESSFLELLNHARKDFPGSAVVESDIQALDKLPLPAIAYQDKQHHFVVISAIEDDEIVIHDPYEGEMRLSRDAFDQEWSGQVLLTDYTAVEDEFEDDYYAANSTSTSIIKEHKLDDITGGCCGNPIIEFYLGMWESFFEDSCNTNGGGQGNGFGSPIYGINPTNLNVVIYDVPAYYTPGKGPEVRIQMVYNSGDAAPPSYFGNKWSFNYDTHYILDPSNDITIIRPDGRRDTFTRQADNSFLPPVAPVRVDDVLIDNGNDEYTLILKKEKLKYHYNSDQSLAWIEDRWGNRLTFYYDASKNLDYMTDALGQRIEFETSAIPFSTISKIDRVTLPDGRYAEFTYGANGNLRTVRDMAGYVASYDYIAPKLQSSDETDPGSGGSSPSQYYAALGTNDISSITTPKGTTTFSAAYPDSVETANWDNYSIVVTNTAGEISEHYWDGSVGHARHTRGLAADVLQNDGRVTWDERQAGISTLYEPGTNGVINAVYIESGLSKAEALSQNGVLPSTYREFGDGIYLGTNFLYDETRNVLTGIQDAYGKTITLGYDANNNLNNIKDQYNKETILTYDANDNLEYIQDPENVITRFEYNANDGLKKITLDRADPSPDIVTQIFYTSYGKVDYIINPENKTIDYGYNANGQLTSITNPANYALNLDYDAKGRLWKVKDNTNQVLETYTYDDLDKLIRTDYADGTFEALTRTCCRIDTYLDRAGKLTVYGYDAANRLETITHPDTGTTTYLYDNIGRLNGIRDANNRTTAYTLNAAGWVMNETRPDNSVIRYARDYLGRLVKLTRDGRSIGYQYDDASRISRIDYSDGSYRDYAYYDNGLLNTLSDANGTFTWTYDDVNRLATFDGPGAGDTQTFGYDNLFNLTSLSDPRYGTVQYQYDSIKNRLDKVIAPDAREFIYSYTPDVFLKLDTITYPNNTVVDYDYDGFHRPTAITHKNSLGTVLKSHSYSYNDKQYFDKQTYNDGRYLDYTYDDNGRLDTAVLKNPDTSIIRSDDYNYDKVGNRTLHTRNGSAQTFKANKLNQMSWQAATPGSGSFNTSLSGSVTDSISPLQNFTINGTTVAVDGAGNYSHPVTLNAGENVFTLSATDSAGNVQTNTQTLFYGVDISWAYDGWGNLIDKTDGLTNTKEHYSHNVRNQLTGYSKTVNSVPTTTASYQYDLLNRRTQKTVDGTTTNYIYGNEDILLEQDASNTTIASYIHAPGIDQPLSMTRNGQQYYYHSDMLGSITLITDDSENSVQTYEYDAYGNIAQELDTNFENPYTYTARERDKETRLYYYRARYYDATRGSFIEEDPIGLLGGINMYAYVGGNPVMYVDPWGLEIRVYSSDAWGIGGLNHTYVYSTETGTGRGANGSSGSTLGDGVSGLDNPYTVVELPRGMSEQEFMDGINNADNWNNGLYFPFVNDCHNDLERAFDHVGIEYPGAPNGRFDFDDEMRANRPPGRQTRRGWRPY